MVVPRWGVGSEEEQLVRPLLRFLARCGPVDLLVLEGARNVTATVPDVTTVVLSEGADDTVRAIAHQALAIAAGEAGLPQGWLPEAARSVLLGHVDASWARAATHLRAMSPSTVIVCGSDIGPALALFESAGDARSVVLMLARHAQALGGDALAACRRAGIRLAIDEAACADMRSVCGGDWISVGTALDLPAVDASELPASLSADGYIAVSDGMCPPAWGGPWDPPRTLGGGPPSEIAGWLAEAVPCRVVALEGDQLVEWNKSHPSRRRVPDACRHSVLAHARAVVATDPTTTVGWSVLAAQLRGRPVVVLEDLAGASYVVASGGGFVVKDFAEVLEAARFLVSDAHLAHELGEAGSAWAREHAGSADEFAKRLAAAGVLDEP